MPTRKVLSFLVLLLLAGACGDDVTVKSNVSIKSDVKSLPNAVIDSVGRNWPHAQIKSVERSYLGGTWGDYRLTLVLDKDHSVCPVLSKTGVVKWSQGTRCKESRNVSTG